MTTQFTLMKKTVTFMFYTECVGARTETAGPTILDYEADTPCFTQNFSIPAKALSVREKRADCLHRCYVRHTCFLLNIASNLRIICNAYEETGKELASWYKGCMVLS